MRIDNLITTWIDIDVHFEDKFAGSLGITFRTCREREKNDEFDEQKEEKVVFTVELGKIIDQMRMHDLFFEEIILIQKEDHRRIRKRRISDNRAKQRFALVHSILN